MFFFIFYFLLTLVNRSTQLSLQLPILLFSEYWLKYDPYHNKMNSLVVIYTSLKQLLIKG